MGGLYTTGYTENGVDIGSILVEKSYLIDKYPSLIDNQKAPGLWLWGNNNYGQLGDNTTANKSSPVQTVAGGTNWKFVALSNSDSLGNTIAIKTDGSLWAWGRNSYGELGDNAAVDKSSPVQTICSGTNWKQAACGLYVGAAIKTDGTLWTWGRNYFGQLGDNTQVNKSSPVQTICAGTNWKQIIIGQMNTSAIKTDGTLWTWGYNNNGQLGDNTTANKSSPVQTICSGTNWKQVSAGGYHTGAIKTDGTLWIWGLNQFGQLGDNSIDKKSSPVQTVAGGINWKQLSAGRSCTAAIKTDGTLWTWGRNSYGQLGDNTTANKSSPVQTICSGTNWKQVSAGGYNISAIKTDGTLWIWGANYGRLAHGTTTPKSSPVQTIAGGSNWKQIYVGLYHVAAIKESDEF